MLRYGTTRLAQFFCDSSTFAKKAFFLEILENYRAGRVPLSVASHVLGSWMVRFKEDYLTQQTFFHPYPAELMDIESVNACAARDFWK